MVQPDEVGPLQITMRDLQMAVSKYHAETGHYGSDDEAAAHVRAFLSNAQQMNDLLTEAITDKATYVALFDSASPHPARDLILGVKYARNVVQHVLHIVKQSEPQAMIGSSSLGFHVYSEWEEVPAGAHARLRPSTQKLKPEYDARLRGREVVTVMFEVLRFFAEVVPDAVHRDAHGEWTGFPLQDQPAMPAPLHPEEPLDHDDARIWLDGRLPNGDARVVTGQIAHHGVTYVVGYTFVGQVTFGPFVETVAQVRSDIAAGFVYLRWSGPVDLQQASAEYPRFQTGTPYRLMSPLPEVTVPFDPTAEPGDWLIERDDEGWHRLVRNEHSFGMPGSVIYIYRRARRLNAFYTARC